MKIKTRRVILEYREAKEGGQKSKWGFLFKTPEGQTLIESAKHFSSLAQAEEAFVSLIKSIATNQYEVSYPGKTQVPAG